MEVVELHPKQDADDIVAALRNIADEIERGDYEFTPTIAVVVFAAEHIRKTREGSSGQTAWATHCLGENASEFMARGVLTTAANRFDSADEAF